MENIAIYSKSKRMNKYILDYFKSLGGKTGFEGKSKSVYYNLFTNSNIISVSLNTPLSSCKLIQLPKIKVIRGSEHRPHDLKEYFKDWSISNSHSYIYDNYYYGKYYDNAIHSFTEAELDPDLHEVIQLPNTIKYIKGSEVNAPYIKEWFNHYSKSYVEGIYDILLYHINNNNKVKALYYADFIKEYPTSQEVSLDWVKAEIAWLNNNKMKKVRNDLQYRLYADPYKNNNLINNDMDTNKELTFPRDMLVWNNDESAAKVQKVLAIIPERTNSPIITEQYTYRYAKEITKHELPTINGYKGELSASKGSVKYGCASFKIASLRALSNIADNIGEDRHIKSICLSSGVNMYISDIRKMIEYVDAIG